MTFAPAIVLTLIGFLIAWQFVNPAPPPNGRDRNRPAGRRLFFFAERYRELLATEGIELQIRQTAGSVDNIRLLEDESSAVDLAFVQGGVGGLFEQPGTFPNTRNLDFQLDNDAARYFKHGPPFLQRYLSFWTANLIDRMKVMLLPLVTLLIPLFKIMPSNTILISRCSGHPKAGRCQTMFARSLTNI